MGLLWLYIADPVPSCSDFRILLLGTALLDAYGVEKTGDLPVVDYNP